MIFQWELKCWYLAHDARVPNRGPEIFEINMCLSTDHRKHYRINPDDFSCA